MSGLELKKDADNLRETWLQDLEAMKANEEGGNQESIYKNLLEREGQRKAVQGQRQAKAKLHTGGLNRVMDLNEYGQVTQYTSQQDIEKACHESNRKKLSQTITTTTTSGELVQDLGYTGTTQSCQRILDGTYNPPPDTPQYAKSYLAHLKMPPNIQNPSKLSLTRKTIKTDEK